MCVPVLPYKLFLSGKDMYVHDMYLAQCVTHGVCKMLVKYLLCLCWISMNETTLKRPRLGEVTIKYIYQNVNFFFHCYHLLSFSSFISTVTSEHVENVHLHSPLFFPSEVGAKAFPFPCWYHQFLPPFIFFSL